MFQDQLTRSSMSWLGWYVGWERYSMLTAGVLGLSVAAAAAQRATPTEAQSHWQLQQVGQPTAVQQSEQINDIANYMLVVAGQQPPSPATRRDAMRTAPQFRTLASLYLLCLLVASLLRIAFAVHRFSVGSS